MMLYKNIKEIEFMNKNSTHPIATQKLVNIVHRHLCPYCNGRLDPDFCEFQYDRRYISKQTALWQRYVEELVDVSLAYGISIDSILLIIITDDNQLSNTEKELKQHVTHLYYKIDLDSLEYESDPDFR